MSYKKNFPILLSICAALFFSGRSFATPFLINNSAPAAAASPEPTPYMGYWGGPVLSHVKVYAIYWGPNINSETQNKIGSFLTSVTNSSYMDMLNKEYNTFVFDNDGGIGTLQHIHHGKYMGATTITPINTSTMLDDSANIYDVAKELDYQIVNGFLPKPDKNTYYMIFFPPGIDVKLEFGSSCREWCAYHGAVSNVYRRDLVYAVMPDITAPTCKGCSVYGPTLFDALTYVTSHELAEALTDPIVPLPGTNGALYPEGWISSNGQVEIGDLCASRRKRANLVTPTNTYLVQPEWINSLGACSKTDFTSPQ